MWTNATPTPCASFTSTRRRRNRGAPGGGLVVVDGAGETGAGAPPLARGGREEEWGSRGREMREGI